MNADGRIALVSGANRGIGLEVARRLAGRGVRVVLGSRDEARGEEAAGRLAAEGLETVEAAQLDVTDDTSVDRLADRVGGRHGHLDVLVNNAGVGGRWQPAAKADLDEVRHTLETNLLGPWRLARALVPLLRGSGHGRIVNVSSGMGQLADMRGGAGAYRVSKAGLNALTRVLSAELRDAGILVNAVCPGWVRTDMGGSSATRSVAEGADTVVWLATLPDDGPTGGFFRDREPIPW